MKKNIEDHWFSLDNKLEQQEKTILKSLIISRK